MSEGIEEIDNLKAEELLGPPKYDLMGVFMSVMASGIVGVFIGVLIFVLTYFTLGKNSFENGSSPILLAMITFLSTSIGNILYSLLLSYIFPHIYSRGRTTLVQVSILSIILYIIFAPIYILISYYESRYVLLAYSIHILISAFSLYILVSLISQYRYVLLGFYSGIISLLITGIITIYITYKLQDSATAIFILLGFAILVYIINSFINSTLSYIYYKIYISTGYDPIGNVFSKIEEEEKEIEKEATKILTKF